MPDNDTLTPLQAANIATNSYFALRNWIHEKPVAGVETKANIHNRVLGPANIGSVEHDPLTSLRGTSLANATLTDIHSARTGYGVSSGFGYTLVYEGGGKRHAIIATRGTRPEMLGKPDLITDFRAVPTSHGYGKVHKGFKLTFDSIMPSLYRGSEVIKRVQILSSTR